MATFMKSFRSLFRVNRDMNENTSDEMVDQNFNESLSSLISMGFDESDAINALREANCRQELACEYLLTGLPSSSSIADRCVFTIFNTICFIKAIVAFSEPAIESMKFADCRTKNEKIAWINSPRGQSAIKSNTVLSEFFVNGQLFRLIENPRWNETLNNWLSEENLRMVANKQSSNLRKRKRKKNVWFQTPNSNLSLQNVFHNEISRGPIPVPPSAKYELLTDGFCILRQIVPIQVVDAANMVINGILSEQFQRQRAEKESGVSLPDDDMQNDQSFVSGSTNDVAVMALFYASPIFHFVQSLLYGDSSSVKVIILIGQI